MKRILVILVVISVFCLFSCDATQYTTDEAKTVEEKLEDGVEVTHLSVKIFQTFVMENAALARDEDWAVVKLVSDEEMYYDDKKVEGDFVLIDTYTYETKDERLKTVPVYMRYSEYKKKQK